jgi:ribosomal protein S18 acetylase RimI-like enzyme
MIGERLHLRGVAAPPVVLPLRPEDVPRLRLDRPSGEIAVIEQVAAYPGRSVWSPATLEYVVLAPWRHRPEIAHLAEISAGRHAAALVAEAIERCRAAGDALVLLIEMDERRSVGFHARAGLAPIEQIVTYELEIRKVPAPTPSRLRFERADPARCDHLEALLRLDHAAFPWLWWNSAAEFSAYARLLGVRLFLGFDGGAPVAYVGVTSFAGWGHLDRIAVDPERQGDGLGREALSQAVQTLAGLGARRVGLSTQDENGRSRRLYEAFGVRRVPNNDYALFAAPLRAPAPVPAPAIDR